MSMAKAAAGVSGFQEMNAGETDAGVPLLSDMRRQIESTIPREAGVRPFTDGASALALAAEVCASVDSGTRSCRRLAILFTCRPRCPGTPRSKNDCATSGEVVVYQPERTAVNLFDYYRNRALNGQGSPDPGILAKLYGTFTLQADR